MFPTMCQEMSGLNSWLYFDREKAPSPNTIHLPPGSGIDTIARIVRRLNPVDGTSGHITGNTISYFPSRNGVHRFDRSRNFIFIAEGSRTGVVQPTQIETLNFLQDRSARALFVNAGHAMLLWKTPDTYRLCLELDGLLDDDDVAVRLHDTAEQDLFGERVLSTLMQAHARSTGRKSVTSWEDWESSKRSLLEQGLGLKITEMYL